MGAMFDCRRQLSLTLGEMVPGYELGLYSVCSQSEIKTLGKLRGNWGKCSLERLNSPFIAAHHITASRQAPSFYEILQDPKVVNSEIVTSKTTK